MCTVALPADFMENANETVSDKTTGLTWQRGEAGVMDWTSACSYCEDLSLAGRADWRLPDPIELMSLIDYSRYDPASSTQHFPHVNSLFYWSDSSDGKHKDYAKGVYFGSGREHISGKQNANYVRCVSGQRLKNYSLSPAKDKQAYAANFCISCHGNGGLSEAPRYPNLAGQNKQYIFNQARDIISGKRETDPYMMISNPVVTDIPDDVLSAVANYLTMEKLPRATGLASQTVDNRGAELFRTLTCYTCHGENGIGMIRTNDKAWYKLTADVFVKLKNDGIPENVAAQLGPMSDKRFRDADEFMGEVERHSNKASALKYRETIVRHAGKISYRKGDIIPGFEAYPRLSGNKKEYLYNQVTAIFSGTRTNGSTEIMRAIKPMLETNNIGDDDLKTIVGHLSQKQE